jgi:hypothetical protein
MTLGLFYETEPRHLWIPSSGLIACGMRSKYIERFLDELVDIDLDSGFATRSRRINQIASPPVLPH